MGVLYRLKQRVKMLKDFYVFDTETGTLNKDGSIQWRLHGRPESFRFGVIYGYNYTRIIYSREEFLDAFKEKRFKNKKVFAHNLEYDLNVLTGNLWVAFPDAIFNGKLICCSNGNCMFADSSNIFGKIKLADVGKMLGIKKPDLGDENMFSPNGITAAEINRCITDCEITYEGLIQIFTAAGDIRITQASLSMTYYRRFHQPHNLEYNENTPFFFDSYYGGRTEAFKLGPTNASVIDVNSMYPYAMKTVVFPNPKFLKIEHGKSWARNPKKLLKYFINQILPNYEGLIYCRVNHQKTSFGFLPYKHTDKTGARKLVFPVGRFDGCWNFPEIRFALEKGAIEIEEIDRIIYAERMASPFQSYVDTLYNERFKTDNAFEIYRIKIFMNSLYGKFAQRIQAETVYIQDMDKQYEVIRSAQEAGTFLELKPFSISRNDALLVLKSKGFKVAHSIPSFASYVTSFCRVLLLKKILELEPKRVVYCDTDSIFFEVNNGVTSETQLGGWKLEHKIVTEINGLKNYRYEYTDPATGKLVKKRRLKGVPEKADLIAPNTYAYENLIKTKESLRRQLDPGVLIKRVKHIKGTYDKRTVLENGETKPLELDITNP